MLNIRINDHDCYIIWFSHKHYPGEGIQTTCYLVDETWLSKNHQNRDDLTINFAATAKSLTVASKSEGRKQSLAYCLAKSKYTKDERTNIWFEYFSESSLKEPGRQKFFLDYFTTDEEPF